MKKQLLLPLALLTLVSGAYAENSETTEVPAPTEITAEDVAAVVEATTPREYAEILAEAQACADERQKLAAEVEEALSEDLNTLSARLLALVAECKKAAGNEDEVSACAKLEIMKIQAAVLDGVLEPAHEEAA
ncbi:hypothetical protein HOM50_03515 [bacterium]|nr:hypothetical protein [bacterium]MBT5015446.1 hypothetical protein [bacterium]